MSRIITIRDGSRLWRVLSQHEEILRKEILPGLQDLVSGGGKGNRLESSRGRAVVSLDQEGETDSKVILKIHRATSLREVLKHLLVPSKSKKEWTLARLFAERGIPTAAPIAFCEEKRGPFYMGGVVAMERIQDSQELPGFLFLKMGELDEKGWLCLKWDLLGELGRFVRKLHDSGLDHRDLHPGNFLVRENGGGGRELFLIDLHTARLSDPAFGTHRVPGIAKLAHRLSQVVSRSDLLRALRGYLGEADKTELRRWWLDSFEVAKRLDRKRFRSRTRRVFKPSSGFDVVEKERKVIYHRRSFSIEACEEAIGGHRIALSGEGGHRIKKTRRVSVTEVILEDGQRVIVKENHRRSPLAGIKERFLPSRSRQAWRAAHGFYLRKVPTPLSLAFIEEKPRLVGGIRNFLITEFLQNTEPLSEYKSREMPGAARVELARQVGEAVRHLHRKGLYHRDLSAKNILVRPGPRKDETRPSIWEVFFIDLESVSIRKGPNLRRVEQNLAQLDDFLHGWINETERKRFHLACLKPYAQPEEVDRSMSRIGQMRKRRRRRAAWVDFKQRFYDRTVEILTGKNPPRGAS